MSEQKGPPVIKRAKTRHTSERRAFVRFPCQRATSCQSIRSGERDCWPATLYDVSITGLSLNVGRHFRAGEVLAIELQPPVEEVRSRLFVRVMHATERPDQLWALGCRFVDNLTELELDALR